MIEVKNVTKAYGRKNVLEGVSFTAEKGEITCLVGINGAGKTTMLNAMMNLTPIQSGEILFDGEKLTKRTYEKVAYVPDAMTMPSAMTIRDAFELMSDFYTSWNEKRAEALLNFFRLEKSTRINDLSRGNKAKVNLLFGLSLDVEYILMDEPFSGIDLFSREEIINVFTSHLIEDRGVLLTTHEIDDIEHLIDKVVLLKDGIVVKEFHAETLREESGMSIIDVMREVYKA